MVTSAARKHSFLLLSTFNNSTRCQCGLALIAFLVDSRACRIIYGEPGLVSPQMISGVNKHIFMPLKRGLHPILIGVKVGMTIITRSRPGRLDEYY